MIRIHFDSLTTLLPHLVVKTINTFCLNQDRIGINEKNGFNDFFGFNK